MDSTRTISPLRHLRRWSASTCFDEIRRTKLPLLLLRQTSETQQIVKDTIEILTPQESSERACPACLSPSSDVDNFFAALSTPPPAAERIFRLSGIVLCSINALSAGKRVKRIEQKGLEGGKGKKTIYLE
ncbi:hypothetical protein JCM10295v2_000228 [Rhodotorula toruloides]